MASPPWPVILVNSESWEKYTSHLPSLCFNEPEMSFYDERLFPTLQFRKLELQNLQQQHLGMTARDGLPGAGVGRGSRNEGSSCHSFMLTPCWALR